jgi:uncharacterized HAD superfamily protein
MEILICDIDGVIADCKHRVNKYLVDKTPKDWDGFFDPNEVKKDKPIKEVIKLLNNINPEAHVLLLSTRWERLRSVTEDWLEDNSVDYNEMILKPDERRCRAHEFKREVTQKLLDEGHEIIMAIDDSTDNCKMYYDLGIAALQLKF